MKFQPQFPIERLSGHDGNPTGLVAMRSNNIHVFRRYVIPNNPDTDQQALIRNIFTLASQNFKALTDEQRATWTTYAQIDQIDVLGQPVSLQDMACYVRSDVYKYIFDTAHLTTAPTALPGYTASLIETVAWDSSTKHLTFTLTHNGVVAVGHWVIRVTPALASAQRHARPSDFRLVEGVDADSIVALDNSPTSVDIALPLLTWEDDDWMEVEVVPLGANWSIGTPYRLRSQITVT